MKKIIATALGVAALLSCTMISAGAADAPKVSASPAAEEEEETAVVIALEAPATVAVLEKGEMFSVLRNNVDNHDYFDVKTEDGIQGMAENKWIWYYKSSSNGRVRTDSLEVFIKMYEREDEVVVLKRGKTVTEVSVNGKKTEIETRFLRFKDQDPYQMWIGYTTANAVLYDNPWMRNPTQTWIQMNTRFEVIEDLGDCYLVQNDLNKGYILKEQVLPWQLAYQVKRGNDGSPSWTDHHNAK